MDDFYRENILDHYKNPRNFGRMKNPDIFYEEENPFCGDKIGMEIKWKIENGKWKIVKDVKFYGEGCAISMATASMLTGKVKGKSLQEIKKLKPKDILKLLGVNLTPTRLKCALLPLEVLDKTLDTLQGETFKGTFKGTSCQRRVI